MGEEGFDFCLSFFLLFTYLFHTHKMSEEYFQELNRLKGLCHLPSVQKALDALINEGRQVREPIKRTKVAYFTLIECIFTSFFNMCALLGATSNKIHHHWLCLVSKCGLCNVINENRNEKKMHIDPDSV